MYQFELLRSAFIQKSLNPFPDIPFNFFSLEGQKDPRGEAESLRHRNNRVETRDFLAALNVAPKICGYVPTFGGSFETELGIPPESAHAFGEFRRRQGSCSPRSTLPQELAESPPRSQAS